jgi:hypothetical protein
MLNFQARSAACEGRADLLLRKGHSHPPLHSDCTKEMNLTEHLALTLSTFPFYSSEADL